MIDPVRGACHLVRVGWQTQLPRPRSRVAELTPQAPERCCRLFACHLLAADRSHQGIEHQISPPETPARMTSKQLPDHGVVSLEFRRVVTEPGDGVETVEQPWPADPPGVAQELLLGSSHAKRARTKRSARRQPPAIIGEPSMQRAQGRFEIEGAVYRDRAADRIHRSIIVTNDRGGQPRRAVGGQGS